MKLSIIIPCYNCEKYINECLNSVLKAIYHEDEVICIDDGSTDRTPEILKNISDKRVKVITQQNKGPSAARNAGIEAALGDQILFVDSDDIIFKVLIEAIKAQPEDSLLTHQICLKLTTNLEELDNDQPKQLKELSSQMELSSMDVKKDIMNAYYPSAQALYKDNYDIYGPVVKNYARNILKQYNIRFPEGLKWGEDICFNLEYLNYIDKVSFINVKAYWYRKVDNSLINGYFPGKCQEILKFLEYVRSILKDNDERLDFNIMILKQYIYILQFDFCNIYNPESYSLRKKKAWALKEENLMIREGINYCKKQSLNASTKLMVSFINLKWFGAVDLILKLYTKLK